MERSAAAAGRSVERFRLRARWLRLIGQGTLLAGIGVLDALAPVEFQLGWLYLLPVALIAWHETQRIAVGAALAGGGIALLAELAPAAHYAHPAALLWNGALFLALLLVAAIGTHHFRRLSRAERLRMALDPLTGAYNTRSFYLLAEREMQRARRYGRCLSVAYIDIDAFRHINAAYGHTAGDVLLRRVAEVIRSHTRASDLVARIGSDEFVILFPETGYTGANRAVRELLKHLAERMPEAGWPVTFSIGVVTYTAPPREVRTVLEQADRLMRQAKGQAIGHFVHRTLGNREGEDEAWRA